jgi:hypothetical protein
MNIIGKANKSKTLNTLVTPSGVTVQLERVNQLPKVSFNVLQPLRNWLDQIEIHNPEMARFLSNAIPAQCPFERDIILFGRKVGHIPPLCKLNPFYEQLVGLRFRALCFLADRCGEDVRSYCS